MLSILIAQYNYDVGDLIKNLYSQSVNAELNFEIIIVDDNSDNEFCNLNEILPKEDNILLFRNTRNYGRSYTRNLLAAKAKFENLLFIDCDAGIFQDDFINNYIKHLEDYDVLCGGTKYMDEPPENDFYLRWRYGTIREQTSSEERSRFPHRSFSSFNFLIRKELFNNFGFDSSIVKYGHEDTLFGIQIMLNGHNIKHINNPLYHMGLEENRAFLDKSKEALENLLYLYYNHELREEIKKNIKILRIFNRIRTIGIHKLFKFLFPIFHKIIESHLLGKNSRLFIFDIYKLGYLCSL